MKDTWYLSCLSLHLNPTVCEGSEIQHNAGVVWNTQNHPSIAMELTKLGSGRVLLKHTNAAEYRFRSQIV